MASLWDELADAVLCETGFQHTLPVPVDVVARHLGVESIIECPMDHDGQLDNRTGSIIIRLANGAPERRKRFTMAHEIGHLILASPTEVLVARRSRPEEPDSIERFCDRFAAALLMPRSQLAWEARSLTPTMRAVDHLAGLFDASLTATYLRACEVLGWRSPLLHFQRRRTWRVHKHYGVTSGGQVTLTEPATDRLDAVMGAAPKARPYHATLPLKVGGRDLAFEGTILSRDNNVLMLGTFARRAGPRR